MGAVSTRLWVCPVPDSGANLAGICSDDGRDDVVEPGKGIEPLTYALQVRCSAS